MDPITPGIISGLIVNALSALEKPMERSVRRETPQMERQLKEELEGASSKNRLHLISRLPSIALRPTEEAKFIEFLNSPVSKYSARTLAVEVTAGPGGDNDSTGMQEHVAAII